MMILRPVRPAVAHRAADLEAPGRVDQQAVALGHQLDALVGQRLELRLHDELADVRGQQRVQVDVAGVLRGDHHGVEADGLVAVVLDGDLGLAVRAQVRDGPVLADLGEPLGEAVRQRDRQRHQLGGLVRGVAEHQALVAGCPACRGRPSRRPGRRPRPGPRTRCRHPARCRATASRSRPTRRRRRRRSPSWSCRTRFRGSCPGPAGRSARTPSWSPRRRCAPGRW